MAMFNPPHPHRLPWVSTQDQKLHRQKDALKQAGCEDPSRGAGNQSLHVNLVRFLLRLPQIKLLLQVEPQLR